jgi:hypothetical protein
MSEFLEKSKKSNGTKRPFYNEEEHDVVPDVDADFDFWSKMPYWSLEEGIALLLGKDPEFVNWDIVQHHLEWPFATRLSLGYAKFRALILRAFEMQEVGEQNSPVVFLEWAASRGIEIPEDLQQQVTAIESIQSTLDAETENLLKTKDDEIASLQKRIEELEGLIWEGFDENVSTYSKELAIAVKAHGAVSKNWKKGLSIKKQITLWLQENYPKLMNEEKERIAKMCNWQKNGGAPSTP